MAPRVVADVSSKRGLTGSVLRFEDVGVEVDVDKGVAVNWISVKTLQCRELHDESPFVFLEVSRILVRQLAVFYPSFRSRNVSLVSPHPSRDFVVFILETVSSGDLDEQMGFVVTYLKCSSISELIACVENLFDAMICLVRDSLYSNNERIINSISISISSNISHSPNG